MGKPGRRVARKRDATGVKADRDGAPIYGVLCRYGVYNNRVRATPVRPAHFALRLTGAYRMQFDGLSGSTKVLHIQVLERR